MLLYCLGVTNELVYVVLFSNAYFQMPNFQAFWELDERVFQWYMKTTQIKWKDFKSDLKREYYDESYSYDELIASCDARVHPDQWKLLVAFWLTPKAKVCSLLG